MKSLNEILASLKVEHITGNVAQCKCPCHDDRRGSLTITEVKDKILFKCHAGCDTKDIIAALGLTNEDIGNKPDITIVKYVNKNGEEKELEYGSDKFIRAIYDYKDENGKYICSKLRLQPNNHEKSMVYAIKKGDVYYSGIKGIDKGLYNLPKLIKAVKQGKTVYYCEGEKDVDNLAKLGLTATTCGGTSDWKAEYKKYFIGANVVILADNDAPGQKLAEEIQNDLRIAAHKSKIVTPSTIKKGDVSDYLDSLGTIGMDVKKDMLLSLIDNSGKDVYAKWVDVQTDTKGNMKIKINAGILADTLKKTMKYLIIKNNGLGSQFLYIYDHGVYNVVDKAAFQYYIKQYIPIPLHRVQLFNEVFALMTMELLNANVEDLDADENIINFKNGVLHLDTMELKPHSPKYLSTIQIPFDYEPDIDKCVNNGVFDNYLDFLTSNNADVKKMLLEIVGLCISNVHGYRTKKSLFMYGDGNSGKTQLKALITRLISSNYVASPTLEKLNTQFGMSSIYCKRVVGGNDLPYTTVSELNSLKEITGGDPIDVEFKGMTPFAWVFKGFTWFTMNKLPKFGGDKGDWVYERIIPLQCNNVVPEDKRDSKLVDKMLLEGQYIINLAVTHLKELINNHYKITEPDVIKESRQDYKIDNDPVVEFLADISNTRIEYAKGKRLPLNYVFDLWKAYCEKNNYKNVQTISTFRQDILNNAISCGLGKIDVKRSKANREEAIKFNGVEHRDNIYFITDCYVTEEYERQLDLDYANAEAGRVIYIHE